MQNGPSWEANNYLSNQEIFLILWKPQFHYLIAKIFLPVPILSQINPIHPLISLLENFFFSILRSVPESAKWSLGFLTKSTYATFLSTYVWNTTTAPFFLILTCRWYLVGNINHQNLHYAVSFAPLLPPLSQAHILPSAPFSKTLSLYSFLTLRDQVAHAYVAKNKVIILYILIFILVDNKVTSKVFCTDGIKHSLTSICF